MLITPKKRQITRICLYHLIALFMHSWHVVFQINNNNNYRSYALLIKFMQCRNFASMYNDSWSLHLQDAINIYQTLPQCITFSSSHFSSAEFVCPFLFDTSQIFDAIFPMKQIPKSTRIRVQELLEEGLSSREIASRVSINSRTVDRIRKTTTPSTPMPSSGRKPKLSPQNKQLLLRMTHTGDGENASELAKRLREASGDVSHDTIRYTLKKAGLRAVRKPRKPRLTKVHKEARLNFAKKYKDWTDADWEHVIFSDETSIRCFGNQGRKWIYKTHGAPFLDHQIEGTVKYRGKSLMFWDV